MRVLVADDCAGVVFVTGWMVWVVLVQMVEVERDVGQGVVAFLGGTKVEVLLVEQAEVTGLGGGMELDLLVVQAEVTGFLLELHGVVGFTGIELGFQTVVQEVVAGFHVVLMLMGRGVVDDLEQEVVEDFLLEVVHGLLEEVVRGLLEEEVVHGFEDEGVHGLLEVVEHGLLDVEDLEHGLLVVVGLAGGVHGLLEVLAEQVEVERVEVVYVQVVQLVVTLGLPAAMVDCTWQCLEVVVAGWMCTSISPSMVGHAA